MSSVSPWRHRLRRKLIHRLVNNEESSRNHTCVIFPAYPLVLTIDATAARRHFAALLLHWQNGMSKYVSNRQLTGKLIK